MARPAPSSSLPGWRPPILTLDTRWVFQIGLLLAASQTEEWETLNDDRRRALARIADVTNHHGKAFFVQRDLAAKLPTGTGRGRRSDTGHVTEKTARKYVKDICATNLLHDPIRTTFGFGRGANVYAWAKGLVEDAWAYVREVLGDGLPEFTVRLKKSLRQLQRKVNPAVRHSRKRGSGRLAGAPRASSEEPTAAELLEQAGHQPCPDCWRTSVERGWCLNCLANAGNAPPGAPVTSEPMTPVEFHRVRQTASGSSTKPAEPPSRYVETARRALWRRVIDWVTSQLGHHAEAVAV